MTEYPRGSEWRRWDPQMLNVSSYYYKHNKQ